MIAVVTRRIRAQSLERGINEAARYRTEIDRLRQTKAQILKIELIAISLVGQQSDFLSQHSPGVLQNEVDLLLVRLH
ncbi:hypothetical protein D3C81_1933640 [compost metagenome]